MILSKEQLIKLLVDDADLTKERANRVRARNFQKRQSCILITIEGELPAMAILDGTDPLRTNIVSDDEKYKIQISTNLAERKFKVENVPEFCVC